MPIKSKWVILLFVAKSKILDTNNTYFLDYFKDDHKGKVVCGLDSNMLIFYLFWEP